MLKTGKSKVIRESKATVARGSGTQPDEIYVDFVFTPLRDDTGKIDGVIAFGSEITDQVVARQKAEETAEELTLQVEEAQALTEELEASHEAILRSEDELRALVNAIPTLAWMADANGWISWYNERWYEYTGTSPKQMEGWGWQSVHDSQMLPLVLEKWTNSIATGEPFEMEFPLRSAEGMFHWFMTRVVPVRDGSGQITRWFGTNTDIQAQHEAAEAAHAANKAKSDFLAAMSHETRQPINATLSFLQLLDMGIYGEINAEQRSALDRMRRNQEQLLSVINDILSFARLEAGRLELQITPVRPMDILADLPPLVEPQVAAKGISLSVKCADAEAVAMGDRERILQVLTNLVTNSVRATAEGGRIIIHCDSDEDSVSFVVEDTGIGIKPDKIEYIFSPFVQLERAFNSPRDGVGLGLAISRDLAHAMHGSLSATSQPGVGSRFTLQLPRRENS